MPVPIDLRLLEEKAKVCYIDEWLDFLGWRDQHRAWRSPNGQEGGLHQTVKEVLGRDGQGADVDSQRKITNSRRSAPPIGQGVTGGCCAGGYSDPLSRPSTSSSDDRELLCADVADPLLREGRIHPFVQSRHQDDKVWKADLECCMAAPRRFAGEESKTRELLLAAAEKLMLDEGYAAVSTRNVAAKAGVKSPLIYYYFKTVDDLLVAVHRRRADRNEERLRAMLRKSDQPLWVIWKHECNRTGNATAREFGALAMHRQAIRNEMARAGADSERFSLNRYPRPLRATSLMARYRLQDYSSLCPLYLELC